VEHYVFDENKTDSRIIILYDESVEFYFCYGTRRREINDGPNNHRYIDFQIAFSAERMTDLLHWLSLMNNEFNNKFTLEMHQITLDDYMYDDLDFTQLKESMSKYTELFAYDKIELTEGSLLEKLDILQGTVNP
jgi:hypothetical protein